ncbi:uncharacterized protein METZ01_LOCUS45775 [marine metagenome]|uniref:Uncharacterized protein n=1 Tax=marine metagenome TaxID=408172 RepID=A0A381RP13_9ZZZZ
MLVDPDMTMSIGRPTRQKLAGTNVISHSPGGFLTRPFGIGAQEFCSAD